MSVKMSNNKMHKYFILCCVVCIITVSVCGCSFSTDKLEQYIDGYISSFDAITNPQMNNTRNDDPFFDELNVSYYLYNTLNADEQKIYSEIYDAINHYDNYAKLSCKDVSLAKKIYSYVLADHPEIFWIDTISIDEIMTGKNYEMYLKPVYIFSSDEINDYINTINNFYNDCINGCESNDSYYLSKYFYKYVIDNTTYDETVEYDQSIISAICEKRSVCAGYAKLYQFLMQKNGIECTLITGIANNTNHAWNLSNINGEYYYTDTTWGDMDYTGENTLNNIVNYCYLNITTEEILKTHSFDDNIDLPDYTSIDSNYYVKEGFYVTEFNKKIIDTILSEQKNRGFATIKCADESVYEEIYDYLITDTNITKYIADKESVEYLKHDDLLILTFGL